MALIQTHKIADNPDGLAIADIVADKQLDADHQDNIDSADDMEQEFLAENGAKLGNNTGNAIAGLIELNNDLNDGESFALNTLATTFGQTLGVA